MQVHDRLAYLIQQVASHMATADELQELSDMVRTDQDGNISRQIESLLIQAIPSDDSTYDISHWDKIADNILAGDHPATDTPVKVMPRYRRWTAIAAAIALLLLTGGAYLLLRQRQPLPPAVIVHAQPVISPGGNKAMLILSDGTQIPLDSASNGELAQQGNALITKSDSGRLTYTHNAAIPGDKVQYNTLRTPPGGQFQLELPDGTKVWLNAASSLQYPTTFTGKERSVVLKGEAYFEVAHATLPFRVTVPAHEKNNNPMKVDVLGTKFNIMAYEEEELVKTVLLEGAVKVTGNSTSKRLDPGQGSSLDKRTGNIEVSDHVNVEEAIAWKNGFFQFEGSDIRSVMRQITRWYDVDVVYKADIPAHFRGTIPRNAQVSQVLHMLELTGEVHFEVHGKQIIVSP